MSNVLLAGFQTWYHKLSNWCANFFNGGKVSGSWKVERSMKYMIVMMEWLILYIYQVLWVHLDSRISLIQFTEQKSDLSERIFCPRRKLWDYLSTFSRFISESRKVWVVAKYSITPHFLSWSAAASNSFQSKLRITKASSGVVFCKVKFTKTPSSEYKESDKYSKSVREKLLNKNKKVKYECVYQFRCS